jgi:hypothetical protein
MHPKTKFESNHIRFQIEGSYQEISSVFLEHHNRSLKVQPFHVSCHLDGTL